MSNSSESLRRKINSAGQLHSVVRTMKAMAVASIEQYENAVHALDDYDLTVRLGLSACFQHDKFHTEPAQKYNADAGRDNEATGVIVFGSDQGLIGQFNDSMADYVQQELAQLPGKKIIWAIGERIYERLGNRDGLMDEYLALPNSVNQITSLVGQVLANLESKRASGQISQVYIFHHRPESRTRYRAEKSKLLPFDDEWFSTFGQLKWPGNNLPEVIENPKFNQSGKTANALIREYIFVSLFRACAESLASENASRLVSMQRAEKNIEELLEEMKRMFHQLRQSKIDEELFDVIAGFDALS